MCVRMEKGKVKVLLVEGGGSVGVRSAEACEPPGGVGGGDGRDGFFCVFRCVDESTCRASCHDVLKFEKRVSAVQQWPCSGPALPGSAGTVAQ